LERIELRVRQGGHPIPEAVVRRRFDKGLYNFFHFYQPIADSWVIFNNSEDTPKMIAYEESGKLEVLDRGLFNVLLKHREKK
jgi:predicted ABC-type ATPase